MYNIVLAFLTTLFILRMQLFLLCLDLSWKPYSVVRVICRSGLWFSDVRRAYRFMVCGADGLWTLPPYKVNCLPIQCTDPPDIPEDSFITVDASLTTYDHSVNLDIDIF